MRQWLGLAVFRFLLCLPAGLIASVSLVATQGLTGAETPGSLLLAFGGIWAVLFGLAGAVPSIAGGPRSFVRALISFALGGAFAGAFVVLLLLTHQLGGSPARVRFVFSIPFTLPWLVGTAIDWALTSDEPPKVS
jgi:hypothetical protein